MSVATIRALIFREPSGDHKNESTLGVKIFRLLGRFDLPKEISVDGELYNVSLVPLQYTTFPLQK
jgi:hypothetical protein